MPGISGKAYIRSLARVYFMHFLRNLIILTVLLAAGIGLLVYFTGYALVHSLSWYILLFFATITFLTFYVVGKGMGDDFQKFQLFYFGSSVGRIFLCMVAVFLYVYLASEREMQFAINFFLIYFLYTGFEIYSILGNLRRISKK